MGRQRSKSQMKEQNKAPENDLNKMETSNLPDVEFKTLVIRMLNELREVQMISVKDSTKRQ